jgi:phage terminase small subunit
VVKTKQKRKSQRAEEVARELTEKQKLFCELYISDRECFGNASKAYRTAYRLTPKQYNTGAVSAHHILRNPNVKAYMNQLLDEQFTNEAVDREAAKIVKQDRDLVSKGMMIKEYNKLRQRITDKSEVVHKFPKPILDHVRNSNEKTTILAGQ